MSPQVYLTIAAIVLVLCAWFADNRVGPSLENAEKPVNVVIGKVWQYEVVPLMEDGGVGPESFAFDRDGGGPYTGVSDGRIIKWDQREKRWLNFAVTSPKRDGCGGASYDEHRETEHTCGRPLGLGFSPMGDLYIADAYLGLLVVGPNGGVPTTIARETQGSPLAFTNSLDIDQTTGVVYFSCSSSTFQRRNHVSLILSGDRTGTLMKYDPQTKQVSVLLTNLSFPNGVALSRDRDYILVVETTSRRILRYWLATPKAGTLQVFAQVPGFADNIKRSPRGGYWVGIHSREDRLSEWVLGYPWIGRWVNKLPLDITKAYSRLGKMKGSSGMAVRVSEEGDVLEIIDEKSGKRGWSVSEVEEREGTLWVGSIDAPFAANYKILVA